MSRQWHKKKDIPDRWLDYKGLGDKIVGTPFVAFKVPLHETICENLPEYERHTTREIIEALPELGMVIDLTNTPNRTKYYQPYDWDSNGIEYKWIKCEGHVTPSQELLVHFCHTVKKFINKNPTKLIGIHCTHGLNRTGYFVCSFMVLVLRIPPNVAMQNFAKARGYDIERQNYINCIISHEENSNLQKMIVESNSYPITMAHRRSRDYINRAERSRHRQPNYRQDWSRSRDRNYNRDRSRSRDHHPENLNRRQHRFDPYLPPPSHHQSGARQSDCGNYQHDKSLNRFSRRRRDNQN